MRCRHLYISSSRGRGFARRGCWEITALAPRASRSAMMLLLSNALSAISASKANPSMSGGTPTVSKRCPGSSTKRTRLPSASVRARILVVIPPLERPMAWLAAPLLHLARGGEPRLSPGQALDDGSVDQGVFHVPLIRDGIEKP